MLRLEYERKRKGLTQKELGDRTGIDKANLSRMESGRLYPYPGWKRRLAEVLGVPGDLLFKQVEVRVIIPEEQGA